MMFVGTDKYEEAIDELVHVAQFARDPVTGEIDPDAFRLALGDKLDIWPECIRADAMAAMRAERQSR